MTLAQLLALLEYSTLTGLFVWRVRAARHVKAGDVAGGVNSQGYIVIKVDGRTHQAHRLAWLYMTGKWPTNQIDHIDGDRANNRFDNLREATNAENKQNLRKARSDNLSCGLLGATVSVPFGVERGSDRRHNPDEQAVRVYDQRRSDEWKIRGVSR